MLVYFVNHSSAIDHLGGAERSLIKLVEDWYALDPEFEAFFITKAPRGKFVDALERRGWRYKAFRYRGWAGSKNLTKSEIAYFARDDYTATGQIIATMESNRPDLVVTNTVVAPWGAFAAKTLGIPHAWFVREYGDLDHGLEFQLGRERTLSDIGTLSEAVVANSEAIEKHLSAYIDPSKLSVVYPTLDDHRIVALAAEALELDPFPHLGNSLRVTVVGRLTHTKGQWRVVEAMGHLARRHIEVQVCFVGAQVEAEYDLTLMRRARELGVDHLIVFADEQENPFPYVNAADVCITPSANEAFGRATLEYLVLGKPVIATDAGGSAELVVPGQNGFLFEPADVKALADHLEAYVRSPELLAAHRMGSRERFSEILSSGYDNASAIERLRATAALAPYRLPNIARQWFEFPGLFSARQTGPQVTVGFVVARLSSMARNFVRHPISSVRRRLR